MDKTENSPVGQVMKGYKATNLDGKCRDYQFTLPTRDDKGEWTPGEWHEHEGHIEECVSGFHFCEFPSGVFAYYPLDCRVFEIEVEGVLESAPSSGADRKRVCSRIRFTKEITPGMDAKDKGTNSGNRNSGDWNSGDWNSGDWNSGNRNSGNRNSGDENSGDRNSGNRNSGYRNSGDGNSGNRNSGDWNSGDWNSGDGNSGDRNTGDWNSGYRNSGDGNCTNYQPGFFCQKEPKVQCFDKATDLTVEEFREKYWRSINNLARDIHSGKSLKASDYDLPNITQKGLDSLVESHRKARSSK